MASANKNKTVHEREKLIAAVIESAKYRQIDATLVAAVAASEAAKGRNFKETVKAIRNKLHRVAGAYLPDRPDYAAWLAQLQQADSPDAWRTACRTIMAQHASTRERLPILAEFYNTILADLPPIHTILDLACGLNPLARAWMPLADDATYTACDIYQDQVDFLSAAFARAGTPGQAHRCNLLDGPPSQLITQPVEVALLLKTIPCLEQMDKEIGPRLLASINAPMIIVSYPVRSLGGRAKGMAETYAAHFAALCAGQPWRITRFDFASELVFRIER